MAWWTPEGGPRGLERRANLVGRGVGHMQEEMSRVCLRLEKGGSGNTGLPRVGGANGKAGEEVRDQLVLVTCFVGGALSY